MVAHDPFTVITKDGKVIIPTNPFFHRLKLTWYDVLKIVIGTFTIAPLRILGMLTCLLCSSLLSEIATMGRPYKRLECQPINGWRKLILWFIAKILMRGFFFAGGFYWVKVKGVQVSSKEAPIIVVAPHSSYFDMLVFALTGAPSIVARSSVREVPLIGKLLDLIQTIYVERDEAKSRQKAIAEIKNRATCGKDGRQTFIFPEGTCSNRSCLVSFKVGAFIPGTPVQPVIIKFPNKFDSISWTWEGLGAYCSFWWTLVQFVNYCEVEYLPVYIPNKEERSDANLFARNVREKMARALGVPMVDFAYEDGVHISTLKTNLPRELKKMAYFRKQLNISSRKELDILKSILTAGKFPEFSILKFVTSLNMTQMKPVVAAEMLTMFHVSSGKMDIKKYLAFALILNAQIPVNRVIPAIFLLYSEGRRRMSKFQFTELYHYVLRISRPTADRVFTECASGGHYMDMLTFISIVQKQFNYIRLCGLEASGLIVDYPPRSTKFNK